MSSPIRINICFAWACQAIGAKNSLTSVDARVLDDAFRAKLAELEVLSPDDTAATSRMTGTQRESPEPLIGGQQGGAIRAEVP
jgi:hypothetical protein